MSLRSPLDADTDDDLGPLAGQLPQPKKKTTKTKEQAPKEQPETQPAATEEDNTSDDEQAADPPPNGGGQVPPQAGTQVGTPPGTQVGRTEEKAQDNETEKETESPLDFSMRAALADEKDPEQDWLKSGWQAKRYRKAAVRAAVKFKWKGYKEEQDVVDAALAAYLPQQLMDEAREMARRGEL